MKRYIDKAWRAVCVLAALALAAGVSQAQEDVLVPGGPLELTVRTLEAPAASGLFTVLMTDVGKEEDSEGEYWLGVQVTGVPELAKKQLGIEQGLAVVEVMPDSPASKSDIRRFDILIKASDTPLKELSDLVSTVEASEGKEIVVTLLREGKNQTIKVTAAKRPHDQRLALQGVRPEIADEIRRVEDALQQLKAKTGDRGVGVLYPRPGWVVPQGDVRRAWSTFNEKGGKADLPSDVSVRIFKEGDQPAKIHVKRGDKEWDVTEDRLNELPEDLRPHVERYLGKGLTFNLYRGEPVAPQGEHPIRITPQGKVEGVIRVRPFPPAPPMPPRPPVTAVPPHGPAEPPAPRPYRPERGEAAEESQLAEVLKELREMRKEMNALKARP